MYTQAHTHTEVWVYEYVYLHKGKSPIFASGYFGGVQIVNVIWPQNTDEIWEEFSIALLLNKKLLTEQTPLKNEMSIQKKNKRSRTVGE